MQDDGSENRVTPFGILYGPKSITIQFIILAGSLACIPAIAWLLSLALGSHAENALVILSIPFFVIFALGYGLWISRLNALAFIWSL